MSNANALNLDVRQLQLVQAVAEGGSLTAAANTLHLTQSALSHRLKALEEWAGTPIFHRVGRAMVLTEAGEAIRTSAGRVLGELGAVRDRIDRLLAGDLGRIRLATECYTAYHWLPRILPAFKDQFPNVDVQIEPSTNMDLMSSLRTGSLELAIISHTPVASGVETTALFEDHLCAVVSPNHRWAGRATVDRAELAQEHLLVYSGVAKKKVDMLFGDLDVSPAKVTELQLTEAILEWVAADLGITVLPRWAVGRYYSSGAVEMLPVDCASMKRTWYAATLGADRPAFVQHLIELIIEKPPTGI